MYFSSKFQVPGYVRTYHSTTVVMGWLGWAGGLSGFVFQLSRGLNFAPSAE